MAKNANDVVISVMKTSDEPNDIEVDIEMPLEGNGHLRCPAIVEGKQCRGKLVLKWRVGQRCYAEKAFFNNVDIGIKSERYHCNVCGIFVTREWAWKVAEGP